MIRLSPYGLLWRLLPGPVPVKLLFALALFAAAAWALFTWVFPVVAEWMPFNDITVED